MLRIYLSGRIMIEADGSGALRRAPLSVVLQLPTLTGMSPLPPAALPSMMCTRTPHASSCGEVDKAPAPLTSSASLVLQSHL